MIPASVATKRGQRPAEATYRRGVWAVTPWLGSRGFLKTQFTVTHVPTGCKCTSGMDKLTHEAAVLLCQALDREFPEFMADAAPALAPNAPHNVYRVPSAPGMGARIRELVAEAQRTAQVVQSQLRKSRK